MQNGPTEDGFVNWLIGLLIAGLGAWNTHITSRVRKAEDSDKEVREIMNQREAALRKEMSERTEKVYDHVEKHRIETKTDITEVREKMEENHKEVMRELRLIPHESTHHNDS